MSYDVTFEINTGGTESAEIAWRNYTSNVSGMWAKALALPEKPSLDASGQQSYGSRPDGNGGWQRVPIMDFGVRLLDGAPAVEAAGVLADAVKRMEAAPEEYTSMNPENGWGDYEGALEFLRWMAEMAAAHPAATIRVSS